MINLLKKHKIILLSIVLSFVAFTTESQSKSKQRNINKKTKNAGVKVVNKQQSSTDVKNKNSFEGEDITKYNAQNLYFKCMNKTCFSKDNGRCSCNTISVFEKSNENCKYIAEKFSSQTDDILNMYKRMAKNDCSSFVMQENKNSNVSISNNVAKLTECMQSKCKESRIYDFVGCFDEDNFEKKFAICEKKVLANVNNIKEVRDSFKDEMEIFKKKYCEEMLGTLKDDGNCYLQIGIGPTFKTIRAKKEFKIGDEIVCSEEAFGTNIGESIHGKIRASKSFVLFGLDAVKTGLNIAATVVGANDSIKELKNLGKDVEENIKAIKSDTGITIAQEGLGLLASQNAIGSVVSFLTMKDQDTKYSGYCYIIKGNNKKELFGIDDEVYYKLRWAPGWEENQLSHYEEEE